MKGDVDDLGGFVHKDGIRTADKYALRRGAVPGRQRGEPGLDGGGTGATDPCPPALRFGAGGQAPEKDVALLGRQPVPVPGKGEAGPRRVTPVKEVRGSRSRPPAALAKKPSFIPPPSRRYPPHRRRLSLPRWYPFPRWPALPRRPSPPRACARIARRPRVPRKR